MRTRLSLNAKVAVLNVMTVVVFGALVLISVAAFDHVEALNAVLIDRDVDRLVSNSLLARELAVVFSETDAFLSGFYRKDDIPGPQDHPAADALRRLIRKTEAPALRDALSRFLSGFIDILDQCRLIKTHQAAISDVQTRTADNLSRLEAVIAETMIDLTLRGRDCTGLAQFSALASSYKESFFEINYGFAAFDPLAYDPADADRMNAALENLQLRLRALAGAAPKISRFHHLLDENVQTFQDRLTALDAAVKALQTQIERLAERRAHLRNDMAAADRSVIETAEQLRRESQRLIQRARRAMIGFTIGAALLFGLLSHVFLSRNIRKPMAAVQEGLAGIGAGDLDREISLGRHDEWAAIEEAVNGMTRRIKISYEELEQKNAELRKSEEHLAITLNAIGDAIIVADTGARIVKMNPVAETLTGWPAEEALGRDLDDVFRIADPDTGEKTPHPVQQVVREGTTHGLADNTLLTARDGTERRISDSAAPIRDRDGAVVGVVMAFRDVTRHYDAEKEREALQHQLGQAQKMESIGRLAGGVAHDLNNLLSPILGYGEMLLEDAGKHDPRRASLKEIVAAGMRARDLVRQLLAFSRKQALEFRSLDLNALLQNFENLLRRTIREDVALRLILAPSLPAVTGDAGQLEQVVMNLAVNAQDAMPGGGELIIETRRIDPDHADGAAGSWVLLAVRDTGCGMTPEVRERIFEPFYTTKGKEEGTGLGLATVYGIVKQHGGRIRAHSEPGLGATFDIRLPASAEAPPVRAPAAETPAKAPGAETILLVEDNEQVRNLTLAILEREGYVVLAADGGKAALETLNRHDGPVHLLLTDVVMPEINGRRLFERAAALRPDLKVLYMSGYTDDVIARHGVIEPGVRFIHKPFTARGLAARVREALDQIRTE